MTKQWIVAEKMSDSFARQFPELHQTVLQLLWNRGIVSQQAIDEFLNPDFGEDLHDPFLFRDMRKAVSRIFEAIDRGEKIVVYGDYDADGVSGSVILKTTLDALKAEASVYLPHREKEGYGLSSAALEFLKKSGAKLVVTCDCGSSNKDEIAWAQKLGIDVIITDHHRIPPSLPDAFAIIHPLLEKGGYPYPSLTGGAVAFKLAQALIKNRGEGLPPGFEKWLLDLVAISIIADVGKLTGENRTLLKYGLIVLNKTRRLGLQKLYSQAGIKPGTITPGTVAWQITPRINAAGRMNHANVAFALLAATDENEADRLAEELNQANGLRQKVTEAIVKEASALIAESKEQSMYLLYRPNWNAGVVGLSASRLVERFGRPVVLATKNGDGNIVGSARSIDQFNVVEAFDEASAFLLRFGGHPRAAGFTTRPELWDQFKERMEAIANGALSGLDLRPTMFVDAKLSLSDVSWELLENLELLAPYGEGNREPFFLLQDLEVSEISSVGTDNQHLRLSVKLKEGGVRKLIGFCFADPERAGVDWCKTLRRGSRIDAVVSLGINEWNGNREIQMKIIDLRLHENTKA